MAERKMCSECPWKVNTKHNKNMIVGILKWFANGSRKTTEHRCHKISSDLFGSTDSNNVCIGSKCHTS